MAKDISFRSNNPAVYLAACFLAALRLQTFRIKSFSGELPGIELERGKASKIPK